VTTTQTIELKCPHCAGSMPLVRRIELKDMPAIYIFYCSRCQHAETLKRERTVRAGRNFAVPCRDPSFSIAGQSFDE
jgi:hypothetical protein